MFSPVNNKRVYQHVVEQIQQQIYRGELKKGDKLPPERDLTEQLGVSRSSVREALRALEVTGLVESRQGEGNFISGNFESALLEPLTAMFMLNNGTSMDLIELRTILEVKSSELAAERITHKQSVELIKLLDKMNITPLESSKAEMDIRLHYYIAEITGNILIINVLSIIASMMEKFIQNNRQKILENPNSSDMLMKSHEDIVHAIVAKDPKRAKEAMVQHMRIFERITMNDFELFSHRTKEP